jgi:hypothetical protein
MIVDPKIGILLKIQQGSLTMQAVYLIDIDALFVPEDGYDQR